MSDNTVEISLLIVSKFLYRKRALNKINKTQTKRKQNANKC